MRMMLFTNNKQQAIVLSTTLSWVLSIYPLAGYMHGWVAVSFSYIELNIFTVAIDIITSIVCVMPTETNTL